MAAPKVPGTQPMREPGDDSTWDGATGGSLIDSVEFGPRTARAAVDSGYNDIVDVLLEDSTCHPRQSQSPIEEKMFAALVGCGFSASKTDTGPCLAKLHQQYPIHTRIGILHADYAAIREIGKRSVRAALELDGHEFHAKTKEQVASDNRRNRAMAREGWIVVRFSGSEVFADAGACALEFAGIIIEAIARIKEGR